MEIKTKVISKEQLRQFLNSFYSCIMDENKESMLIKDIKMNSGSLTLTYIMVKNENTKIEKA
jgi:hypothetical protein